MTEVPKIVYDRLRAARPQGVLKAHPDANLLTAFAEQALSAQERGGVLEHLALCEDCREVVACTLDDAGMEAVLIAPGTESFQQELPLPKKSQRSWLHLPKLAWPTLSWAALAAGVALAAAVLLLHPGKPNPASPTSATQQASTATPSMANPAMASSEVTSATVGSSTVASATVGSPAIDRLTTSSTKDKEPVNPEARMSIAKKQSARRAAAPLSAQSGMQLADNKAPAQADTVSAQSAPAPTEAGQWPRGASETVEVSAAAIDVQTSEVQSTAKNPMATDVAPIVRAKPPLPEPEIAGQQSTYTASGAAPVTAQSQNQKTMAAAKPALSMNGMLALNVTWAITAGVLQRSFNSGQTWQNALHADRRLLCYAINGSDVWTGGQAGTLFHSTDNGLTWVQVRAAIKSQALSADITHIDIHRDVRDSSMRGSAEIVVSATNSDIWVSADGGQTWNKK